MTATYTFDVFSTLDGFGSYNSSGDWGGYWSKKGPEFLESRHAQYEAEQRMVLGANTFRQWLQLLGPASQDTELTDPLSKRMKTMPTTVVSTTLEGPLDWPDATLVSGDAVDVVARLKEETEVNDPVNVRMKNMPTTVVSTTLEGPLDWPNATLVSGDAVDVVARLKEESEVPLRSHGSLSLNRALMAAGLVDRVQLTIFPVITGQTGTFPIFDGAADFDLELIESRVFDGRTQELVYRPTLHRA